MAVTKAMDQQPAKNKTIKCVVWDLDHTLWEGVLLEDDRVSLRSNIPDIIKTLDKEVRKLALSVSK